MTQSGRLETDYLVIGAGLAGLAFADAMIGTNRTVTIVDRRHAPGGHWLDAYPFVRLHQPSRLYGVVSTPLGEDRIIDQGIDQGLYERASGREICGYFDRLMQDRLLASGQVRFMPRTDYLGDGKLRSLTTSEVTEVTVRRKVVDARYLEGAIPANTPPPFGVASDATCVTPGDLVHLDAPREGFVVIGAGKTSMDTCQYLLDQGVDPERIRWIRPRDLWLTNREHMQGGRFVVRAKESVAIQLEAAAQAKNIDEFYDLCADKGFLLRLDESVRPQLIRGATSHRRELEQLRQIEQVIRLGYVQRIERDRIVLDEGSVPTSDGWIHVHCAAAAIPTMAPRPIFEADRITMQYVRIASPSFSFGLTGALEASDRTDEEKNALAAPNAPPQGRRDWIRGTLQSFGQGGLWRKEPDLAAWLDNRLDLMHGIREARTSPEGQRVDARFRAALPAGSEGFARLAAATAAPATTRATRMPAAPQTRARPMVA